MFVLGVTGPTGAGKGTVCEILEKYGFWHIDTDRLVPIAYDACSDRLRKAFGDGVFSDGKIDKVRLAAVVFSSKRKLKKLNAILHPEILRIADGQMQLKEKEGYTKFTIDGVALREAGAEKLCDRMLCVLAGQNERKDRIIQRDRLSEDRADLRLNAQKTDDWFTEISDYVLINDCLADLENKLKSILGEYLI